MARSAEKTGANASFDAHSSAPQVPCNSYGYRSSSLWEGKLSLGELTIWTGAPGKGFVSADLIARVVNGAPFPPDEDFPSDGIPGQPAEGGTAQPAAGDTAQPASVNTAQPAAEDPAQAAAGNAARRRPLPVVVVASNRDTFDSVARRVEAAGGDTERLYLLPFFATDDSTCQSLLDNRQSSTHELPITPRRSLDLEYVENLLGQLPQGVLVVVDPIMVRLARRGAELRDDTLDELRSWAAVARRSRAAVLVITGGLPPNTNRAYAALASCGVAASIWALYRDENFLDDRRYLVPLRSSGASDATSLVLRIRPPEGAEPGAVARVEWREAGIKTAEALVLAGAKAARRGPLIDAERWLLKCLADGPVAVNWLKSEVEKGDGEPKPFSWRTVLRAMSDLSILSMKKIAVDGKAQNEWSLPVEQWRAGQTRRSAGGSPDATWDGEQGALRGAVLEKLVALGQG